MGGTCTSGQSNLIVMLRELDSQCMLVGQCMLHEEDEGISLYCRHDWHRCRAGMVHQRCRQCTAAGTAHRETGLSLLCTGTSLTAVSCRGGGLTAAGSYLHMQTARLLSQHGWGNRQHVACP